VHLYGGYIVIDNADINALSRHPSAQKYRHNKAMLHDYPDVMDIVQVSQIIGTSTKTVYTILHNGDIAYLKVGRSYRIPKTSLLDYLGSAKTHK
jgi:excisionase family DNA binding protein